MGGAYLEGEKALERLGDLTELICRVAEDGGVGDEDEMLRYDQVRARFVMQNHLNKNAGWD
jgi:hypothetical protein